MKKLNQLKFPDDSLLGFLFIIGYIVLDSVNSVWISMWQVLGVFYRSNFIQNHQYLIGFIQIIFLIFIAVLIAGSQIFMTVRRSFSDVDKFNDSKFIAAVTQTSKLFSSKKIFFVVTKNIFDTNSFCMTYWNNPVVVFGGGLRLLFRKKKDEAMGIIAHECAHIAAGDTVFMLFTWYFFIGYVCIAMLNFFVSQYLFWVQVPFALNQYLQQGQNIFYFIKINIYPFFSNGFPDMIAVTVVAISVIHFIKQREYRADEAASHFGFQQALVARLDNIRRGESRTVNVFKRIFFKFHPTSVERIQRLSNEGAWSKIDILFIMSISAMYTRLDMAMPTIERAGYADIRNSYMNLSLDNLNYSEFTSAVINLIDKYYVLEFLLGIGFSVLYLTLIFRVTATQYKLQRKVLNRLEILLPLALSIFFGSLISFLTWTSTIRRLIMDWGANWSSILDAGLIVASGQMEIGIFMSIPIIILSGLMISIRVVSPFKLLVRLIFWGLITLVFLQFLANIVFLSITAIFDMAMPDWSLSWLPNYSRPFFIGGVSGMQIDIIVFSMIFLLIFINWVIGFFWKIKEPGVVKIHSSWLVML